MFVTCFDTVEPSLLGEIQVSDLFSSFSSCFIRVNSCADPSFFSPVLPYHTLIPPIMADARSTDRIGNYTKFWDKDMQNEKAEVQGARVDHYTEVVNGQQRLVAPLAYVPANCILCRDV